MNLNRRKILVLSGGVLAGLSGCIGDGGSPSVSAPGKRNEAMTDEEKMNELADANTRFALDLHQEVVNEKPDVNHLTSPLSVSISLAMVYAGSDGKTKEEIESVLNFDVADLHETFNALDQEISDVPESNTLRPVNAVWPRKDLALRDSYVGTLESNYGVHPVQLDYKEDADGARDTINGWISEQTEGLIEASLPSGAVTRSTAIVVTNALYFKAPWSNEFDPEETSPKDFTEFDGSTNEVQMMSKTGTFHYGEVDGHQVVELPYKGDETSMVVVLPPEGTFTEFEKNLDMDQLDSFLEGVSPNQPLKLELPRFEFSDSNTLKESLRHLGMNQTFGDADLSRAFESANPAIENVYHDSVITVDEEGTEAAAATSATGLQAAAQDDRKMIVDRPFLFMIRDRPTDSVVFLGRMVKIPT